MKAIARMPSSRICCSVPDVLADPEYDRSRLRDLVTVRAGLAVPMVREGIVVGVVQRRDPRPFSDKQIWRGGSRSQSQIRSGTGRAFPRRHSGYCAKQMRIDIYLKEWRPKKRDV